MVMVLFAHVFTALFSIVYASYLLFTPSKRKFYVSYASVAATVASGTYLVIKNQGHILKSCITGLIYLGIVGTIIISAQVRFSALAAKQIRTDINNN